MARFLIALFCLLQGRHSNGQPAPLAAPRGAPLADKTAAATLSITYKDVPDECTPGSYCSDGVFTPHLRGLCVSTPSGNQCWDACNRLHDIISYGAGFSTADHSVAFSQGTQKAIAMMVKQLRTGKRYGSCPGSQSDFAEQICNPGERCTPPGLTWGRGMCITIPTGGTQTDQCLDMCDTSIPLTTYKTTPGKEAGTLRIVRQVQAGRDPSGMTTCPGITVWVWLWLPISLCCLLACCFGAIKGGTLYRDMVQRPKRGKQQQYPEPMNEPYMEEGQGPYQDYGDQQGQMEMAPPQTMNQDMMDDPMPVIEPQAEPLLGGQQEMMAPLVIDDKAGLYQGNLFDQPNLMAGLAPLTVAAPTSAYPVAYPGAGSNYITSYAAAPVTTSYAQQGTTASFAQAAPVYLPAQTAGSFAQAQPVQYIQGAAMTTQPGPTYGAYGAYGTTYPGTTSMRIG